MTDRTCTHRCVRPAAALLLAGALACSPDRDMPESIDLQVSQVYVTEPVLGERAAMYFSVTNNGSADDALVGVSTEAARVTEIHRTAREGDVMRMERVEALTVPAGTRIDLAPGGYHLMLLKLTGHLFPGDGFDVTLRFRHAGTMLVRARVIAYEDVEQVLGSPSAQDPHGPR